MPSAFGARDFLEVKASTMSEMLYGSMLYTVLGILSAVRKSKPV